jgi:hypothetical protein
MAQPFVRVDVWTLPAADPILTAYADAVAATTLGLKNLSRVAGFMFKGTSTKVGDPWDDLEAVYGRMVTQWSTEMGHVVKIVGGLDSQQVHIGQQGMRFKTVPKAKQAEASAL